MFSYFFLSSSYLLQFLVPLKSSLRPAIVEGEAFGIIRTTRESLICAAVWTHSQFWTCKKTVLKIGQEGRQMHNKCFATYVFSFTRLLFSIVLIGPQISAGRPFYSRMSKSRARRLADVLRMYFSGKRSIWSDGRPSYVCAWTFTVVPSIKSAGRPSYVCMVEAIFRNHVNNLS